MTLLQVATLKDDIYQSQLRIDFIIMLHVLSGYFYYLLYVDIVKFTQNKLKLKTSIFYKLINQFTLA